MSGNFSDEEDQFVCTLDVGTTTLRCFLFDKEARIRGERRAIITLEYPQPGWVEIDPEGLWENVIYAIKGAIQDANISPAQIKCMSISTQRSSFLFWDANNNAPITKIISWKDTRASDLVSRWNGSLYIKGFRFLCKVLYTLTKNKRYLSGSVLKVMNELVAMRLLWVLENVPKIREKIALNQVKFGTLDTFLVHKLTNGEKHVTDFSNACVTGYFDPFVLSYAEWALKMYNIPTSILPKLVPTCGPHFGHCKLFREKDIPILCVVADQSASLFGSGSFQRGSVKITLGTGAFLDVNTGSKPHASVGGIYPLVGWKYGNDLAYIAEGQSKDNGNLIEWGKRIGLYSTVQESSRIAESAWDDNGSCFFIPAFNGLQAPYNDTQATSGFFGMKENTSTAHMARALLESLAFRVQQLLNILQTEAPELEFDHIKVDGGVSSNDFMLQTIANLSGTPVVRPECREITALGCAFMAGVNCGFWNSREDLQKLYHVEKVFYPQPEVRDRLSLRFAEWEQVLQRFLAWDSDFKR